MFNFALFIFSSKISVLSFLFPSLWNLLLAQAGPKLLIILLPQLSKSLDYGSELPVMIQKNFPHASPCGSQEFHDQKTAQAGDSTSSVRSCVLPPAIPLLRAGVVEICLSPLWPASISPTLCDYQGLRC